MEHLKQQREIMAFMEQTMREYGLAHEDMGHKLLAITESSAMRFERSLQTTISSFFKSPVAAAVASNQLSEVGTTSVAWHCVQERMVAMGDAYCKTADELFQCADSMAAYLRSTQEAADKVDHWGNRLCTAMANYIQKSEEAKESYHSKARSARLAQKFVEEAERQSQLGGITRAALFTESRVAKLRDSASRARDDEVQAAAAYRAALDLVARKQSELYSVRMPRVMDELQRLVEERTERVRAALLACTARGAALLPSLQEALAAMALTVEGISAPIDSKVFVASNTVVCGRGAWRRRADPASSGRHVPAGVRVRAL